MGGEGTVLTARTHAVRNPRQIAEKDSNLEIRGRSVRRNKQRDDKWKRILLAVGKELKKMKPQASIQRVYKNVIKHLDDAIPHIVGYDIGDSESWASMYGYFGNSRYFFNVIADTLSISSHLTKDSLFNVFDALVKGLSFEKSEWDSQENYDDRSTFLVGLLSKIGGCLEDIDDDDYYEKVIGRGCSENMQNVYSILKGKTADAKSGRKSASDGWKDRLERVMDTVDTIAPVHGTEWVFNGVKKNMHSSVNKIKELDLNDHLVWSKLFTHLDKRLDMFSFLEMMPGGTGTIFGALREGLESELSKGDWNSIKDIEQRNEKIDEILKTLGHKLESVNSKAYKNVLGSNGVSKMKLVADILEDEA